MEEPRPEQIWSGYTSNLLTFISAGRCFRAGLPGARAVWGATSRQLGLLAIGCRIMERGV